MTDGPRILVVDDEPQIRRFLEISLRANGYTVQTVGTGAEGLAQTAVWRPDVVILDLGLPDMDGLAVLGRLREWSHVPVIVLTVRDSEEDKVSLLDAGADDYLTKPFSIVELLARLRAALRHAQAAPDSPIFRSGRLEVDLGRRMVSVEGQPVKLTATEYSLLRMLVQHPGRVLTHGQLLREVWGPEYEGETQYLRVYVAQLRRKLEEDASNPKLLTTEPGVGYRLQVER
jgi:two-component system KDP operon response regulator KdpE